MHFNQENGLKPHFGPFWLNWPIFDPNISNHRRLTCCKKSEKFYDGKYENCMDGLMTDRQTEGRK